MWVEFTWGNSNAFPTSFHFLHALEKELNFGSPTDENCYNGERERRQTGWEFKEQQTEDFVVAFAEDLQVPRNSIH